MLDKSGAVAAAANEVVRLVYCTYCGKMHAVTQDETPCGDGAWIDPPPVAYPTAFNTLSEPRGVAQMRYQRELATQRDDADGR